MRGFPNGGSWPRQFPAFDSEICAYGGLGPPAIAVLAPLSRAEQTQQIPPTLRFIIRRHLDWIGNPIKSLRRSPPHRAQRKTPERCIARQNRRGRARTRF